MMYEKVLDLESQRKDFFAFYGTVKVISQNSVQVEFDVLINVIGAFSEILKTSARRLVMCRYCKYREP